MKQAGKPILFNKTLKEYAKKEPVESDPSYVNDSYSQEPEKVSEILNDDNETISTSSIQPDTSGNSTKFGWKRPR